MKSADETARSLGTVNPDVIRNYRFSTAFRGYDTAEVRAFLNSVADAVATYSENASAYVLSVAESVNPAAVAGNAAVVPAAVEPTPEDLAAVEEARADAESIVAAAKEEANAIVTRANDEAARIFLRARAESRGKPSADTMAAMELALADAPSDPNVAKEQARIMISEAKAVRERILTDLAKRRRVAHVQLEQLRVAREKLLESFRDARRVADEASRDLSTAEVEARLAAETAGRRVGTEDLPTVAELEAELFSGRSILSSPSNAATPNQPSSGSANNAGSTNQPFDLEAEVDPRSVTQEPDGTDVVHAASPDQDLAPVDGSPADDLDTLTDASAIPAAEAVPGESTDPEVAVAENETEPEALLDQPQVDASTPGDEVVDAVFVPVTDALEDQVVAQTDSEDAIGMHTYQPTFDVAADDVIAASVLSESTATDELTSEMATAETVTVEPVSVEALTDETLIDAAPTDEPLTDEAVADEAPTQEALSDVANDEVGSDNDLVPRDDLVTNVVQFADYASTLRTQPQAPSHPAVQSAMTHDEDATVESDSAEPLLDTLESVTLVVSQTETVITETLVSETVVSEMVVSEVVVSEIGTAENSNDSTTDNDTQTRNIQTENDSQASNETAPIMAETGLAQADNAADAADSADSASPPESGESPRGHAAPSAGRLANVDDLFARLRRERESAAASAHELLDGSGSKGGSAKPGGTSSGKGKKTTPKSSGNVMDRTLSGTEHQHTELPQPTATDLEQHTTHDAPTASSTESSTPTLLLVDLTEFESEVLSDSRFDPNSPETLSDDLFPSGNPSTAAAIANPEKSAEFEFVTGTLQAQCTRAMKRFLQDEQSRALAAVRTARGRVTLDDLLGDAEAREQRLGDTVQTYLTDAYRAGADLSSQSVQEESVAAELKNLEIGLASTVTGTTRTAIDQAMNSDLASIGQTLSDAIADVYRSWPSERLSTMVAEHLRAAFQLGHGLVH